MTELTRRQMRELERAGQTVPRAPATQAAPALAAASAPISNSEAASDHLNPNSTLSVEIPLTRREMRMRESGQSVKRANAQTLVEAANLSKSELNPISQAALVEAAQADVAQDRPHEPRRLGVPLPPVGPSRRERARATESSQLSPEIQPVQLEEVEIPEQGLMGSNYLGEPSTQSIVLDVAPEAISLPIDTGEIFTTGSIAILPDTTGSTTGSLDGIDLDTEDAVTGIISVVDPVSARDLIDERSPLGVVPSGLLRKGWWRPWVVGALSVLMALAAILASITIFNSIGG